MAKEIVEKLRHIEIAAKQSVLDLFAGMYHSAFKGQGLEIEDIREYQPGDDVRAVSWKKTAQMGKPFVKTFREERDLTVILLCDVSGSLFFESHFSSKRERMAEVAATLAFSAIYNHDRVGLILFSSEVEKYIPPKRGMKHGLSIIYELLSYTPKKKGTDIAKACAFLLKVLKKRAICFLVSDFLSTPFVKDFQLASQKNDLIALRVFDPEEEKLSNLGLVTLQDLESGKVALFDLNEKTTGAFQGKRKEYLSQLKKFIGKSGASAIDIDTKDSYIKPIATYFKMRKKKMR